MKETVNANIGSMAFTLDTDAYRVLGSYFDDIRRRLPEGDAETMSDIETRVAEIFREKVASPMRVITLDVVRATMEQMGSPADFGEPRDAAQTGTADEVPGEEPGEPAPANSTARARSARSPASAADWPPISKPTRR